VNILLCEAKSDEHVLARTSGSNSWLELRAKHSTPNKLIIKANDRINVRSSGDRHPLFLQRSSDITGQSAQDDSSISAYRSGSTRRRGPDTALLIQPARRPLGQFVNASVRLEQQLPYGFFAYGL
jgi:hypothetical protein